MLTEAEILKFINNDKLSRKKELARKGQAYYDAEHDIKKYRVYYVDGDGKLQEDKLRSNIKISHPFFTELVDQQVQYMLSGEGDFVRSDDEKLQEQLSMYFGDDFKAELQECLTGCIAKGFEHMYAYKAVNGKTKFMTADSLGVIDVREKDTDDGCAYVIYWYVDRIDKGQTEIKRIEVWDENQTWYYVQKNNGQLETDTSAEINPRPHITYTKSGDDALYYEGNGGYGFIPFFRLDNNRKQVSGLKPVKDLIDDYDLMACGLSNNLQDVAEGIYVVKGFEGMDMDEMIQNIRVKKHVGVSSEGGVDIKTIDVPYEARKVKLELDEKNIYRFGMGFNSAQIGDGNITNIVIKSRYALLDLKSNKLEIRLKQFLRKMVRVALDEINTDLEADYQMEDIYIRFEREVMTNAQDNAQIELLNAQRQGQLINNLMTAAQDLDQETVLRALCEILELDYEEVKEKLDEMNEGKKTRQAEEALNRLVPDDGGGGTGE
ncbi:MAG: phage portal protein [Lachnospiraceae bacterium]|nr:phage portal protein [Lachnospiraceae bacterium]